MAIRETHSERRVRMSIPGGILDRVEEREEFGGSKLGNLGDVTLIGLTLRGKKLKAVIEELITNARLTRTVEGASTVTIVLNDYQRTITKSALATEASHLVIDGMRFVLVKVRKNGNSLELVFEDWAVVELRKRKGPKKAVRGQMTRAQFAESLVKEVKGLKFYSPEKNVKQEVYPYDTHNVQVEEATPTVSGGSGSGGGGPGSGTREKFALDLLNKLNYPTSGSNRDALVTWMVAESGGEGDRPRFNPMCTTQPMPGHDARYNSANVKHYDSWNTGVQATYDTLTNGSYATILAALAAGTNAMAVCVAVDTSPWGTEHCADALDNVQANRSSSYNWAVAGVTSARPRNVSDANPDTGTNQTAPSREGQEPGFDPGTTFTIQGDKATNQQIGNMARILRKAVAMGVNTTIQQAAIVAAITDSNGYNLKVGDSPTRDEDVETYTPRAGIFQYKISEYPQIEQWTIAMQAEKFLNKAKYFYDLNLNTGQGVRVIHRLANDVTRRDIESFDDYGRRYMEFVGEARSIVQLFNHTRVGYGATDGTDEFNQTDYNLETNMSAQATVVVEPYEFSRGTPEEPEDSWTCLQRLADEVNWRCFSVNGTIYFCRDKVLLKNKALDTITEFQKGIDYIDFDYDVGKPLSMITVNCHAERWAVPPGACVVIKDLGAASGRYIVQEFERSMHSDQARVMLYGAEPQLKEPAPDTHVESIDPDGPGGENQGPGGGGALSGTAETNWNPSLMDGVNRVIRWARSKAPRAPGPNSYVYGGGHHSYQYMLDNPGYDGPWDCSSFVSFAYSKVGVDLASGGGTTGAQWDEMVRKGVFRGGTKVNGVGMPPGGWKPGDLIWPRDTTTVHIIMATGNGDETIEASGTNIGLRVSNRASDSVQYWARPAELIPMQFRINPPSVGGGAPGARID